MEYQLFMGYDLCFCSFLLNYQIYLTNLLITLGLTYFKKNLYRDSDF